MPRWLDGLLSATRILLKNTLEAYVERRVRAKVDAILQEHRLVSLITQLRGHAAPQMTDCMMRECHLRGIGGDSDISEHPLHIDLPSPGGNPF